MSIPAKLSFLRSALAAGLLGGAAWAGAAPAVPGPRPVAVGQAMPDAPLLGLNGKDRSFSAFHGRRTIINVWASWCGPCRAEAASLERFAWGDAGARYTVIGISTDDDRNAALRWLRQQNATLAHFIDRQLLWETLLGASHIPMTVLVDERGRVVGRIEGAREWDSAESVRLIEREFQRGAQAPARKASR